MRKVLLGLSVLSLLTASCARPAQEQAGEGGQGPQTRTVQVDATPREFAASALAYFPDEVRVRPGDTVSFRQVFTGEPHSVTMGTMIDEVIPEARRLGPESQPSPELERKLEALPVMLPEGPGDANQIAVNPCYLDSGPLPTDATKPCPNVAQPRFNGRQAYYNSGYLPPEANFSVTLADDIRPGNYSFYCNLHGPMMSGTIRVIGRGDSIPSQQEVDRQARQQIDRVFEPTRRAFEEATTGRAPFPTLAGYGSQESMNTAINEFIPRTIRTRVGETVTWVVFGPHTISFNPTPDAQPLLTRAPDNTFHLNEKAVAPAGGPGQPPPPPEEAREEGTAGSPSPAASPT
ncbi:MAG: hypothetical protein M3198_17735, partial [Actinomycetota bacterium]|nr:hypothetical protein [Actinomycetota bacterium]